MLGTGWKHASPQRRWQVTALRLPCVWPAIGSRERVGLGGVDMVVLRRTSGRADTADSPHPGRRRGSRRVDAG
ncbi:hypothetical protein GCM10011376_29110 [Nocardioides flavus (ex Wang et al. 2016)]|uniref:Uncharacterized protein n=1 Tax=Nocardioides flavus (ex Wang et al. 2016) TaxID=2058780 RepID=A0ABQ3HNI5_9ACTN|nr:hypothetical protein GCM10011376_29110 [Nocardioides flavus (ex Wang et al. 2016)]